MRLKVCYRLLHVGPVVHTDAVGFHARSALPAHRVADIVGAEVADGSQGLRVEPGRLVGGGERKAPDWDGGGVLRVGRSEDTAFVKVDRGEDGESPEGLDLGLLGDGRYLNVKAFGLLTVSTKTCRLSRAC